MKVVILVALLCCSLASCAIRVVDKSPPDGKIVLRGRSVRLSCRADARWFLCVWRTPSNEKSCAIQHGDRSETVCNQVGLVFALPVNKKNQSMEGRNSGIISV